LALLIVRPELAPIAYHDLRRALLQRFPYVIYYRAAAATLEVRACLHQRVDRDPASGA
jgi:plasmid stabilization system protein ParE